MTLARPHRTPGGVLAVVYLVAAVSAPRSVNTQPQPVPLIAPSATSENTRREIVTAVMTNVGRALQPCFPQRPEPHDTPINLRPRMKIGEVAVTWRARFRVLKAGAGGQWTLTVTDEEKKHRFTFPVGVGLRPEGESFATPLIETASVTVSLRGPGGPQAACPNVLLEQELMPLLGAKPRGVHGADERWAETSAELAKQPDAATIRAWAKSTVRVTTFDNLGRELPCSAFFLSEHVLLTASHCVESLEEASQAVVFLPNNREARGTDLKLLAVQGDLDFSLMRVDGGTNPDALLLVRIADITTPLAFVLWQHPSDRGKVVSVRDCDLQASRPENRPPEWMHHCDSSVGTSGSPLQLRVGGRVFGLHTRGCMGVMNGTGGCENFATRIIEIRARLAELDSQLRAVDPQAAAEIAAALLR